LGLAFFLFVSHALLPSKVAKYMLNPFRVQPVLGLTRNGIYIGRVTKSVFTKRYKLFLTLLISIRESKELSQHQLAKKLKKPQSFVSKYERGERRLDVVEFLDIMSVLETDPFEVLMKIAKSPK
jgi:DNA-binding transcriptional regulator YiaG